MKWHIKKQGRYFRVKSKEGQFKLTAYFLKQLYPLFKIEANRQEIKKEIWHLTKERLFFFLARRDRSEWEIKMYLRRLAQESFFKKACVFLKGLNLLDDKKLTQKLIEYRKSSGFGPYYIKQELWRKGVKKSIIEKILEKEYNKRDEEKIAKKVFKKYQRKLKNKSSRKTQIKTSRYLAARGFSQDIIYQLINNYGRNDTDEF